MSTTWMLPVPTEPRLATETEMFTVPPVTTVVGSRLLVLRESEMRKDVEVT